jgi:hypothetical protein
MPFWTIGTLFGASSVMLGAFGAHGLKQRIADPARIANWGTAAQYQVRSFHQFKTLDSWFFCLFTFIYSESFHLAFDHFVRYLLANPSKAHPLLRPDIHRRGRAAKYVGHGLVHSGHVDVQWVDLFTSPGSSALQIPRTRDAVGWVVSDRGVGCPCGAGEACSSKSTIEIERAVGEEGSQ